MLKLSCSETPEVTPESSNRSVGSCDQTERNLSKRSSGTSEIPSTEAEESTRNLSRDARSEEAIEKREKEDSSRVEESCNEISSEEINLTRNFHENGKNNERQSSDNARKKIQSEDTSLVNYYPNIPGPSTLAIFLTFSVLKKSFQ